VDSDNDMSPGSPRWYLSRMTQRLLSRQFRYDRLERYAQGDHDLPNGDKRYVVALRELQRKCRTNYCELVIKAVTERMRVIGFQFGPDQQVDEEAKAIWYYNDMEVQSQVAIMMAATFGDAYIMVTPPPEGEDSEVQVTINSSKSTQTPPQQSKPKPQQSNPDQQKPSPGRAKPEGTYQDQSQQTQPKPEVKKLTNIPWISVEDPRMCITEQDPRYINKTLAGLKLWQDDAFGVIRAVLYLPDNIYEYEGPAVTDVVGTDTTKLTHTLISKGVVAGGFKLVSVQPNPIGEVPLIRINWQPAFGSMGRAEAESIIDIQDRINHTILDRLVIAKAQAYNQRWMTGGTGGENFRPGSDMVWATQDSEANFGQFEAVDLKQILEAVRDDVGDLAAVSQTPATYLMNRMVNVSGDTLTQDQSALIGKIADRQEAVGWGFARAMRLAFAISGDEAKSKETEVCTLWKSAQIFQLAELADSFSKFTGGGVPLDIAMQITGLFTNDQIESARQQFEQQQLMQQQMLMDQQAQQGEHDLNATKQQGENQMNVVKQQGQNAVAVAKAKPKPAAKKPTSSK
jgi:hypothetical protein